MKKVIVGFDGTDEANDALQLGASLANAADAELIVAITSAGRGRSE